MVSERLSLPGLKHPCKFDVPGPCTWTYYVSVRSTFPGPSGFVARFVRSFRQSMTKPYFHSLGFSCHTWIHEAGNAHKKPNFCSRKLLGTVHPQCAKTFLSIGQFRCKNKLWHVRNTLAATVIRCIPSITNPAMNCTGAKQFVTLEPLQNDSKSCTNIEGIAQSGWGSDSPWIYKTSWKLTWISSSNWWRTLVKRAERIDHHGPFILSNARKKIFHWPLI